MNRWFIPGAWAATVGAQFRITPDKSSGIDGPVDVEVLDLVPERRLVMQWSANTLHAEMVWELAPTDSGCRLLVVQTGFLGTPQSVRARQVRAAYWYMFARALPALLADATGAGAANRAGP
ncbi:MAG TPA: SRPBCC domain-containing protein, partial [Rugosimonospora sp.]|nr:SRPBCC domain-containing protein [Rugosimonospora sp.]